MRRRAATSPTARSPKPPGRGLGAGGLLVPLAALAATTMLAQGDQSSLAQAVSGIQRQFGASDQVLGLIPFCMAICGAIGAIPIGVLADRHRRTWLLAAVCAIWAAAMGAGGLAIGFGVLFATRMLAGAAEGTPPAAISLLSDYFPVRRRSEAMGIYQAGAIAGAFIGLVGGGIAVQLGGWPWAFWIWVPIGVGVAAWYLFLPEPARGHQDAAFEATVGTATRTARRPTPAPRSGSRGPRRPRWRPRGSSRCRSRAARSAPPGASAGQLGALRALLRIPTMWFGTTVLHGVAAAAERAVVLGRGVLQAGAPPRPGGGGRVRHRARRGLGGGHPRGRHAGRPAAAPRSRQRPRVRGRVRRDRRHAGARARLREHQPRGQRAAAVRRRRPADACPSPRPRRCAPTWCCRNCAGGAPWSGRWCAPRHGRGRT